MKYLFLVAALLLLAACTQTAQDTIPEPGDTNEVPGDTDELPDDTDESSGEKLGTHMICEDGQCYQRNGCPEGYDEFMAQIGPACVKHYGKEEIGQWPTCTKSSDTCDCTYVARDTLGNQLSWDAQGDGLRCAPANYRDYMIHNGLSGVDENGEEYAMIA